MFPDGLAQIRAAEPRLRLGWSVPRVRRDYTTDMLTAIPALAILTGYRAMLPRRARTALREGRFDAIMAHWRVVTGALAAGRREGGGELYVWTVDDAAADRAADGDGRRRDHHQRPAPVQPIRQLAALKPAGSAPARLLCPGGRRPLVRLQDRLAAPPLEGDDPAQRRGRLAAAGTSWKLRPPWRTELPAPTYT